MENVENSVMDIAIAPLRYKIESKLKAAELVSKNDVGHFDRVLPLESQPMLAQLREWNDSIVACVQTSVLCFVQLGYLLNQVKLSNSYRYVQDKGLQGYTSFFKFCADVYGLSKKTVQRLIAVNVRYCGNGPDFIVKGAERYSFRQLAELASFKNGLDGKVPPKASVRDIEKLYAYYSSREWEVSNATTWQEDLAAYSDERSAESKRERDRVKKFAFESGPETRQFDTKGVESKTLSGPENSVIERPKNAYKEYDLFLEFVDQSAKKLEELRKKCPDLVSEIDDISELFALKGKAIRALKSRLQFSGF